MAERYQTNGDTATKEDTDVKEPPMYKVLLLNDNYTTMDFVVMVLEKIFNKTSEQSKAIMLNVHERGRGIAGVYPKEVAETKIALVHSLSRQNEFPLKCIMESA